MEPNDLRRFAELGLRAELARLNAALEAITQSSTPAPRPYRKQGLLAAAAAAAGIPPDPKPVRRTMSKAARKRISIATKARWAAKRLAAKA